MLFRYWRNGLVVAIQKVLVYHWIVLVLPLYVYVINYLNPNKIKVYLSHIFCILFYYNFTNVKCINWLYV